MCTGERVLAFDFRLPISAISRRAVRVSAPRRPNRLPWPSGYHQHYSSGWLLRRASKQPGSNTRSRSSPRPRVALRRPLSWWSASASYRLTNPTTLPPSTRKDSSTVAALCSEKYPQAMATRIAVLASFSDPSAVSNRSRAFPAAAPKPSERLSAIELMARRNCDAEEWLKNREARSRSLRCTASTRGRDNATTPRACSTTDDAEEWSKDQELLEFCIPTPWRGLRDNG